MRYDVVLVEPKYEGNVGSVARVMKNFGFTDLVLVNPSELGDLSRAMASHAIDILDNCKIACSFEEAVATSDLIVGTTGTAGTSDDEHIRMPFYAPAELKEKLDKKVGVISLVFGREDAGLSNEELKQCDMILKIPTSDEYPVMNLSHAVAVILYELSGIPPGKINLAKHDDLERLYAHCGSVLEQVGYPEHKCAKTLLMLRRILGRAILTGREVQTLRGILRKIEWRINR
ncbi:MAG: RNA methyltransferase [Methanocellales archaeon]|nr:RNA methyltransferase [Methanocellales archaeon]MDD3291054.1 RNA methyltransferase [Methanocellales archaeon]MDD5234939.1 RNA methyltransferase [Methanocellales archaeon]MDD5484691.1 RNA methyltransferase [Methanocellales archaeon]